MSWAKVDDQLHSHPKAEAAGGLAMGLWVMALSWCAAHLTDGRVDWHVPARLGFAAREARRLVAAGLWVPVGPGTHAAHPPVDNPAGGTADGARTARRLHADNFGTTSGQLAGDARWPWRGRGRGAWTVDSCGLCQQASGLLFRDWSDYQPTKAQVLRERELSAARQERWRKRHREDGQDVDTSSGDDDEDAGRNAVTNGAPSRPVLLIESSVGGEPAVTGERATPPRRRCERHEHAPTPGPCRACGDARRDHDAWQAAQAAAPRHPPPACPLHPEHLARTCPTCAAEGIPAPVDLREHLRRRTR